MNRKRTLQQLSPDLDKDFEILESLNKQKKATSALNRTQLYKDIALKYLRRTKGCITLHTLEVSCGDSCAYKEVEAKIQICNRTGKESIHFTNEKLNAAQCTIVPVKSTIYVCLEHNVVHICTEQLCCAPKVTDDGVLRCIYTGKVYEDTNNLSHGWIEDPWRHSCNSQYDTSVSNTLSAKTQIENMCRTSASKQTLFRIECKNVFNQICRNAKSTANSEFFKEVESMTTFKLLMIKIKHNTRMIMPEHPLRVSHLLNEHIGCMTKAMYNVEKFVRRKLAKERQVSAIDMYLIINQMHISNIFTLSGLNINIKNAQYMMTVYLEASTKYALLLCKHTNICKSVSNFTVLVYAILYLQKQTFKLANVLLFQKNPLLELLLPLASKFNSYNLNKTLFTMTKAHIKTAIVNALSYGKCITMFIFPTQEVESTKLGNNFH